MPPLWCVNNAKSRSCLTMLLHAARKAKIILRSNIARITGFIWSPNSKLIAGCCSDGCVIVWNATTGSIHSVLEGDRWDDASLSAVFASDLPKYS